MFNQLSPTTRHSGLFVYICKWYGGPWRSCTAGPGLGWGALPLQGGKQKAGGRAGHLQELLSSEMATPPGNTPPPGC